MIIQICIAKSLLASINNLVSHQVKSQQFTYFILASKTTVVNVIIDSRTSRGSTIYDVIQLHSGVWEHMYLQNLYVLLRSSKCIYTYHRYYRLCNYRLHYVVYSICSLYNVHAWFTMIKHTTANYIDSYLIIYFSEKHSYHHKGF